MPIDFSAITILSEYPAWHLTISKEWNQPYWQVYFWRSACGWNLLNFGIRSIKKVCFTKLGVGFCDLVFSNHYWIMVGGWIIMSCYWCVCIIMYLRADWESEASRALYTSDLHMHFSVCMYVRLHVYMYRMSLDRINKTYAFYLTEWSRSIDVSTLSIRMLALNVQVKVIRFYYFLVPVCQL